MGGNGDHEWLRMTNAFILCDLVWKVQKSHAENTEGSLKCSNYLRLGPLGWWVEAIYTVGETKLYKVLIV